METKTLIVLFWLSYDPDILCIHIFITYVLSFFSDARREARKAFLAFACSEGNIFNQTKSSKSESTSEVDGLVDAGKLVSESTPVSNK